MDDDEDILTKHCKAVLVGEISTGKTSIINQFIKGEFNLTYFSTISPTNMCKTVQTEKGGVQLDIWDTAGQEKYRGLNKLFYSNAQMAILVYDITNKKSFKELQTYWVGQIKENCPKDVVIGIAGNKADLFQKAEVTEEEGEQLANDIGALHKLTSCLKNMGIESLFVNLSEKFLMLNNTEGDNNNLIIKKTKGQSKRNMC